MERARFGVDFVMPATLAGTAPPSDSDARTASQTNIAVSCNFYAPTVLTEIATAPIRAMTVGRSLRRSERSRNPPWRVFLWPDLHVPGRQALHLSDR